MSTEKGNVLFEQERFEEARAEYEEAVKATPDEAAAHNGLGRVAVEEKRHEDAEKAFRRAKALKPAEHVYSYNLGLSLNLLGRHEDAIAEFREALRVDPGYASARVELGDALYTLERFTEARAEFEKVIEAMPNDPRAHNSLGRIALKERRHEDADKAFRRAKALKPAEPVYSRNLGLALRALGRREEAIQQFREALQLDPGYSLARNSLGDDLYALERFAELRALFEESLRSKPDDPDVHSWLGTLALDDKRPEDAEKAFRQAKALKHDEHVYSFNLGVALEALGRRDEAAAEYTAALKIQPLYTTARLALAPLYRAQGRMDEAKAELDRALADSQDDISRTAAQIALGRWAMDRHAYKEAEAAFRAAIASQPTHPWAHFNLALLLGNLGRYVEAEEAYRRAIEVAPKFPFFSAAFALHNIADMMQEQGKHRQARERWREVRLAYERDAARARALRDGSFFRYHGSVLFGIYREPGEAEKLLVEGAALDPNDHGCLVDLVALHLHVVDEKNAESSPDAPAAATQIYWSAQECYLRALRLLERAPETHDVLLETASLRLSMEELDEAQKCYAKALEKNPESAAAYTGLGIICTRREEFAKAIEHFTHAVRRAPNHPQLRSNLGEAYLKAKQFDAAEREFSRVLRTTADHVESLVGLAEVYTAMAEAGDVEMYEQAIAYFDRGIRAGENGDGSKKFKRSELAAVLYSRGYAKVMLYEDPKTRTDESLLKEAAEDFRRAKDLDAQQLRARRALVRVERRLFKFSREQVGERVGRFLVTGVAVLVFIAATVAFFWTGLGLDVSSTGYATLAFGSLIFMAVGLYLPQVLKLRVAGIELEKSAVEQISPSAGLGIRR